MRTRERNGLEFVAEKRVPADFFNDFINGINDEDIQEIIENEGSKWDITNQWDMYINESREQIEEMLKYESGGTILEMDKIWRELVNEYLSWKRNS